MTIDRGTRLSYIATTAFDIQGRLQREANAEWDADPNRLREDLAWLCRSVAWLARLAAEED